MRRKLYKIVMLDVLYIYGETSRGRVIIFSRQSMKKAGYCEINNGPGAPTTQQQQGTRARGYPQHNSNRGPGGTHNTTATGDQGGIHNTTATEDQGARS